MRKAAPRDNRVELCRNLANPRNDKKLIKRGTDLCFEETCQPLTKLLFRSGFRLPAVLLLCLHFLRFVLVVVEAETIKVIKMITRFVIFY